MLCHSSRVLRRAVPTVAPLKPRCVSSEGPGGDISDAQNRTTASLYVHWPYCLKRCSYCNFNKYLSRSNNNDMMTECLQKETQTLLQLSQVSCITSVFFGGGTPSLAPPSTIAAVLESVSQHARLPQTAEVTLEVNPTPTGMSKLEDFYRAGVNRFSIGVQSLNNDDLRVLGRDHSSSEAVRTVEKARRLCPGRVSVDVMFGRPKQTVPSWESEMYELLKVCDDHVSLYQLTLERGTQLFRKVNDGEVKTPDDDVTAEMYRSTRTVLHQHGFQQYEVSNFARNVGLKRQGLEKLYFTERLVTIPSLFLQNAVSHHNLSYWKGRQYIGVGPGAHGRFVPSAEGGVFREARTQTLEPDVWMCEVQQRGHGTRRRTPLHHRELLEEVLVMGMRMTQGITHKHWQVFSPHTSLRDVFVSSPDVQGLLQDGKLILDERGLRCSYDGLALLDSILPTLLVELERTICQKTEKEHGLHKQG